MARRASLTPKKRAFVDAWFSCGGDDLEAARRAGYRGSTKVLRESARKLRRDPFVIEAMRQRTERADVATEEDCLAFWTRLLRGEPLPTVTASGERVDLPPSVKARLEASKYLGMAKGMFVHVVAQTEAATVDVIELPDNGRGDRLLVSEGESEDV